MGRNYSHQWSFAFGTALDRLENLIWQFDAIAEADHKQKAYTEIKPSFLLHIIEGFLDEKENLMPSDISRLHKMHNFINQNILQTYNAGLAAGYARWDNTLDEEKSQFVDYDFSDYQQEAIEQAPESISLTEKNWFIEGYALGWREKWMKYLIEQAKNQ